MLSRIIAAIIIGIGLLVLIGIYIFDMIDLKIFLIPILILLAITYVFSAQLDWWGYGRRPPKLDHEVVQILKKTSPFYSSLDQNQLAIFNKRLALIIEAKEFMMMGHDHAPYDLKVLSSAQAVRLTLGLHDFMLDHIERIVFYRHHFPSPQFKKLHSSETHLEDGVVIFSTKELIQGLDMTLGKSFNIALYEFAKALKYIRKITFSSSLNWNDLEKISNLRNDFVKKYIGIEDIDMEAVAIVYYFEFGKEFKRVLPELFDQIGKLVIDTKADHAHTY